MRELKCLNPECLKTLPINNFTKFDRNPALKDRMGRVIYCKDCASKIVENNGNNKESLKLVLRILDIPYIDKIADSAIRSFNKKIENSAVIVTTNRFTGEVMKTEEDNLKIQSSLFLCYTSKIGLMPKDMIDWSCSKFEEEKKQEDEIDNVFKKNIATSKRYISRQFGNESLKDSNKLSQLVLLELNGLVKKKDKTSIQKKNRLINHIKTLLEANLVEESDFEFLDNFKENQIEVGGGKGVITTFHNDVIESNPVSESCGHGDDLFKEYHSFKDKWSDSFKREDVIKFEREYRKLRKDYIIKTAQHELYLRKACVVSVRLDEALSQGKFDEAKTLNSMFKDLCQQGNLTPCQMDKEENEGISCFGEWIKQKENDFGVIGVVRDFKKQPRDDVDRVILANVNYMRILTGRDACKQEDIYKFYDELAKSFDEEVTIDDDDDFLNGGDSSCDEDGDLDE